MLVCRSLGIDLMHRRHSVNTCWYRTERMERHLKSEQMKGRANGMAQQVRALAAKPDNLVQVQELTWWKERTNSYKLLSDLNTHVVGVCLTHSYTHTHN